MILRFIPNFISTVALALVFAACSSPEIRRDDASRNQAGRAALEHSAVLAGDYPDPSVVRVGDTYWATATSSAWAPIYPLLSSKDLVNWKLVASVFPKRPAWASIDFWAPEIAHMNTPAGERTFVYYAARNKKTSKMCVAVATAAQPQGPYTDHGPMICEPIGSIDAVPVVDEQGRKFIFWKEDSNSVELQTPIRMQQLSDDGLRVVGERKTVLLNDKLWEGMLVEGPFLKKHGDWWYLFYAANSCCTRACNYSVGVARARSLEGPWEKNPRNPIIQGNDQWRCPGHGSIVTDANGRDVLMYHAMHARDWVYVGRQAVVDAIDWGSDGWPTINEGRGPGTHEEGFLGAIQRNEEHRFAQAFDESELGPGWQWPVLREPPMRLAEGKLLVKAAPPEPVKPGQRADAVSTTGPKQSPERIKGLVARSATRANDVVTTQLDVSRLPKGGEAGLVAYGRAVNNLGAHYRDGQILVFDRINGVESVLHAIPSPSASARSAALWLRMHAREGRFFRFEASSDGKSWSALGPEINGYHLPPWDLGIRWGLSVGGSAGTVARFDSVSVEPAGE